MTDNRVRAFFAYPSSPPGIGETLSAAVTELNSTSLVTMTGWEECKIGGKVIMSEICGRIDRSALFCADLTWVNPNVLFELGFAIMRNKRVWLVHDDTITESKRLLHQLQFLTAVGYRKYCNSRDVCQAFYSDLPSSDLKATVFQEVIRSVLDNRQASALLYLKEKHSTQASFEITNRLHDSRLEITLDDPAESATNSLSWYAEKVANAIGLVCHLTSTSREGASLHNAKCSFVSGLAHGFEVPLLMLAETSFLAPFDYRELLQPYQTAAGAAENLGRWLPGIKERYDTRRGKRASFQIQARLESRLKDLQVGDYIAENEEDRLISEYFVETAAFRDAMAGAQTIFVGRRGAGKTANYLKLRATLSASKTNIVCCIKPPDYELEGVIALLEKYRERDAKGHMLESLWKLILYTEIARAAAEYYRSNLDRNCTAEQLAFLAFVDKHADLIESEFSVRLQRSIETVLRVEPGVDVGKSRAAVSEALHSGVLKELREVLGAVLSTRGRIIILIDNLDKAWGRSANLMLLAEFMLAAISAAEGIKRDLSRKDNRRKPINCSLVLFLRTDIFSKTLALAREPDKIPYFKISWNDPELLFRVAEQRMSAGAGVSEPAWQRDVWNEFFCADVMGKPVKEYIIEHILLRPRDLIYLLKASLANAVNRSHPRVEEHDILDAAKSYSQYALESIKVENGISVPELDEIFYEFLGACPVMHHSEIAAILAKASISALRADSTIEHLCMLGFLGLEVSEGRFGYSEDDQEFKKNAVLARKLIETSGRERRYQVYPAFWPYLEMKDSPGAPQLCCG